MLDRHFRFWPKGLPHHLTLPDTSVCYNLEVSATRYPGKPAVIYYGHELSYGRFRDEVERLAGFLQQRCGVGKGDRVLLDMQNSPQFMLAFYAALRAGAMVVPINPMNLTAELQHYLEDSGARVALCAQEVLPQVQPLIGRGLDHVIVAAYSDYADPQTDLPLPEVVREPRREVAARGVVSWHDALASSLAPRPLEVGPDDYAVLPYTSGTTGMPKGCVHTHRSVMATLVSQVLWRPNSPDSVVLSTLPLFHVTGMQGCMNGPLYLGATMVLMTRWDRDVAGRLIERHRVTGWINIATMAIDFLSNPDVDRYDLSSLMVIGGGGAAMPEAVAEKLHALTGLEYMEGYGLTETMAATHMNPPDRPRKQCLGIPAFDVDARIRDPESGRERGPGEVGEIVIHGPQLFQGYWNRPEATAEAFVELDGKRFFRTGDLGRYDEEGYFFIVDRLKRMINAAGFNVWPAEVEAMMYEHPAIQEACVIGAPDARRGETVKAVVVLRADARGKVTERDIIDWAKQRMSAYKYPRVVAFVDELPKTATGKVQWRQLQEQEFARA
ncbi:MAG TPA: long-chain fatty acid--CoA ligase [Gammaproteobacteria bacterium]|nr:long-chain fatty acid--CoA ligase [Gammaproteobacteria bacterium]